MSRRAWVLSSAICAALIGVLDAGYLSYIALSGNSLECNFIAGCDVVARSPYSRILGIPLALFGFFFYVTSTLLATWMFMTKGKASSIPLLAIAGFGVLTSAYLTYLQAFVIKAFCEYCIFSTFDALVLFGLALFLFLTERATLK